MLGLAVTPVGAVVSAGVFSLAMCLKSPPVHTQDITEFQDGTVKEKRTIYSKQKTLCGRILRLPFGALIALLFYYFFSSTVPS